MVDRTVVRVIVWVGREGIVRWRKEGFVDWFRRRERSVAREMRVEETRLARRGRRVGRVVKGGLERRRVVDSGGRVVVGERRGGRRVRRVMRSGGRVVVVGSGRDMLRGRRRLGFGVGSVGLATVRAVIRRVCLRLWRRWVVSCWGLVSLGSWGKGGRWCTSLTASRLLAAGSFFVEPLGLRTAVVRDL